MIPVKSYADFIIFSGVALMFLGNTDSTSRVSDASTLTRLARRPSSVQAVPECCIRGMLRPVGNWCGIFF
jgi:hypothetical protein